MQNTVSKTAALAGLFSCVLMLTVVFFGITASVHATDEGFIHADEVGTDQEKLKEFVQDAIDAYYVDFLIREHCDFTKISKLDSVQSLIPDLSVTPVAQIKPLINLFPTVGLTRADIDEGCDFTHRFDQVFGREDGDWKSGSIYLFVMDDTGRMLFHGDDETLEGEELVAEDEGGRDVPELLIGGAETSSDGGFVEYCWDDPDLDGDEIVDSNEDPIPGKAPGDSLKISYVVNPFEYLGAVALSSSPGIIFGSGIYPKMDNRLPECNGNGIAGDGGGDMDKMDDMQEPLEEPMDEPEDVVEEAMDEVGDSISGGGCAVAAGSDSTPRNDALNLLLIVSALFLAVSFGNRAVGRRNGIRS